MARVFVLLVLGPAALLAALAAPVVCLAGSLDVPAPTWGLSFGDSPRFDGLRFNWRDTDVDEINGINITLWAPRENPYARYNGLALGLVGNGGERIAGVSAGLIATGAVELRGIGLGGLVAGADEAAGVVVGGLGAGAGDSFAGLVAGGLGAGAGDNMTGVALAGLGAGAGERFTGVGLAGLAIKSDELTGLFASAHVRAETLTGLSVSAWNQVWERQDGLAIAVFNYARELHGVQIGVLNYAGNNRRGTKWLPGINVHFD